MSSISTAAPQVYGGDEINAVILDPGSYTTQAGFAGYDYPSLILPSYYEEQTLLSKTDKHKVIKSSFNEDKLFSCPTENSKVRSIIKKNLVVDWEGADEQSTYMFKNLNINPHEQPLLYTESTMNSYKNKIKAMEIYLEKQEFCAFYAIKQPTCVSFAHGRPNCLIVDIGHDVVTVTPVIDGICLKNQVLGTEYAGNFLNKQLNQFLKSKSISYTPQFEVKNKEITYWENKNSLPKFNRKKFDFKVDESFKDWSKVRTFREMKESLLECSLDDEIISSKNDLLDEDETTRWFELPDGLNIPFTQKERQKLSNSLFNPQDSLFEKIEGFEEPQDGNIIKNIGTEKDKTSKEYIPLRRTKKPEEENVSGSKQDDVNNIHINVNSSKTDNHVHSNNESPLGLTKLVQCVLDRLDIDLKPQLANNIVLTGSTSLIPRLNERLNTELTLLNPSLKIRIHSVGNTIERKYASWIGGSILASLGTFHQLWVSKAEYDDVGPDQLIINRFR